MFHGLVLQVKNLDGLQFCCCKLPRIFFVIILQLPDMNMGPLNTWLTHEPARKISLFLYEKKARKCSRQDYAEVPFTNMISIGYEIFM